MAQANLHEAAWNYENPVTAMPIKLQNDGVVKWYRNKCGIPCLLNFRGYAAAVSGPGGWRGFLRGLAGEHEMDTAGAWVETAGG